MSNWWYVFAIAVLASVGLAYLRARGIGRGNGGDKGGGGDRGGGMATGYHEDSRLEQRADEERAMGAPDEPDSSPR